MFSDRRTITGYVCLVAFFLCACAEDVYAYAGREATLSSKVHMSVERMTRGISQYEDTQQPQWVISPVNVQTPSVEDVDALILRTFEENREVSLRAITYLEQIYTSTDDPALWARIDRHFQRLIHGVSGAARLRKRKIAGFFMLKGFRLFLPKKVRARIVALDKDPRPEIRRDVQRVLDSYELKKQFYKRRSRGVLSGGELHSTLSRYVAEAVENREPHDLRERIMHIKNVIHRVKDEMLLTGLCAFLCDLLTDNEYAYIVSDILKEALPVISSREVTRYVVEKLIYFHAREYGIPIEVTGQISFLGRTAAEQKQACEKIEVAMREPEIQLDAYYLISCFFKALGYQSTLPALYVSSVRDMYLPVALACPNSEFYFEAARKVNAVQIVRFDVTGKLVSIDGVDARTYCRKYALSKEVADVICNHHILLEDLVTPVIGGEVVMAVKNYGRFDNDEHGRRAGILLSDVYVKRNGCMYTLRGAIFPLYPSGAIVLNRHSTLLFAVEQKVGHDMSVDEFVDYFSPEYEKKKTFDARSLLSA